MQLLHKQQHSCRNLNAPMSSAGFLSRLLAAISDSSPARSAWEKISLTVKASTTKGIYTALEVQQPLHQGFVLLLCQPE